MVRTSALIATAMCIACPATRPKPELIRPVDDRALRIEVARAEVEREAGVADLVELLDHGDPHARELAARGLGRSGGARALAALDRARSAGSAASAVTGAIGIAGALGDPDATWELNAAAAVHLDYPIDRGEMTPKPVDPRELELDALVAFEAAGRAGTGDVQSVLDHYGSMQALPASIRAAWGLALGRLGRRDIALEPAPRALLVEASAAADRDVRYGATYALAREVVAKDADPAPGSVEAALAARIGDGDPEIRATAIAGLAKHAGVRKSIPELYRTPLGAALADRDWRVAVEAVRALAGERGDDAGRDLVAAALPARWIALANGDELAAHVVIETERALAGSASRPAVASALIELQHAAAEASSIAPISRGWIECLAAVALARAAAHPNVAELASCGHGRLPDHLRLPLLAELVTSGAGDVSTRRDAIRVLLGNADARVRGAGFGALATTWKDGNAADHQALVATLVAALGSRDPIIEGAAIDAAPSVLDAIGRDSDVGSPALKTSIDAAIIAGATTLEDPEVGASYLAEIGKRELTTGVAACTAALDRHPVLAAAGATCLRALGQPAPAAPGRADPPPVDVADVIGYSVTWRLETTRGPIEIALFPDVAPWNVASIVALTRKGFYDGLEIHRVVPDFVVQGGDPTGSGYGGPGYTTLAEPATIADGAGFVAGAVGIADAGKDSGGSQWFIMHSHAPHLDGRYTWVGQVVAGQSAADALQVGDKVTKATVVLR